MAGEIAYIRGLDQVMRPDLLEKLYKTSMIHFGFWTDRYPRVFEYTWILKDDYKGKRMLDLGCGISPLPIVLAEKNKVVTVDYWEEISNEWGYFDYHVINKNITSYHMDFADYQDIEPFDVIYSISAIEHMTKANREACLRNAWLLLKADGMLKFTIDLHKDTDDIWNRNYGKRIEDNHGTVADLQQELIDAGFVILKIDKQQHIKGVGTDLLYVTCIK